MEPPDDIRAVIDKVAMAVAKSGPNLEERMRQDHRGNEKFSFLFHGGRHASYYQQQLQRQLAGVPKEQQYTPKAPAPWLTAAPTAPLIAHGANHGANHASALPWQKPAPSAGPGMPPSAGSGMAPPPGQPPAQPPVQPMIGSGHAADLVQRLLRPLAKQATNAIVAATSQWVLDHATEPAHMEQFILALQERLFDPETNAGGHLHLVYLYNDLLYRLKQRYDVVMLEVMQRFALPLCHRTYGSSYHVLKDGGRGVMNMIQQWATDQLLDPILAQELNTRVPMPDRPPRFQVMPVGGFPAPPGGAPPLGPPSTAPPQYGVAVKQYFELAAGLMVPLVKMEDNKYSPIAPSDVQPGLRSRPSDETTDERLQKALEAFFNPVKPRNNEGWEEDGLTAFQKAKTEARRASRRSTSRSRSRSRSPRRRRSRSRSQSPKRRPRSRSQSRSRSPRRGGLGGGVRKRSRSPGRGRRHDAIDRASPEAHRPLFGGGIGGIGAAGGGGSKASPAPERPSFGGVSSFVKASTTTPVSKGGGNVGLKMMQKMGYTMGKGLGANESGISEPVKAADVRDKQDLYKGIGSGTPSSDPLQQQIENFRKQRSAQQSGGWKEKKGPKRK